MEEVKYRIMYKVVEGRRVKISLREQSKLFIADDFKTAEELMRVILKTIKSNLRGEGDLVHNVGETIEHSIQLIKDGVNYYEENNLIIDGVGDTISVRIDGYGTVIELELTDVIEEKKEGYVSYSEDV